MCFESDEQRIRIENIAGRINNKTLIRIDQGAFGSCRLVQTNAFSESLGVDASDVAVLTLLYLYAQEERASRCNKFEYDIGVKGPLDYYVIRVEDKAVFCMESEVKEYE